MGTRGTSDQNDRQGLEFLRYALEIKGIFSYMRVTQTVSEVERSFLVLLSYYLIGSELCFRKRNLMYLWEMVR